MLNPSKYRPRKSTLSEFSGGIHFLFKFDGARDRSLIYSPYQSVYFGSLANHDDNGKKNVTEQKV